MNVGVLAYHAACNYGANLQLLSTVEYLKKKGYNPFVINWVPESQDIVYERSTIVLQRNSHLSFRKKYYNETALCRTAEQVADVIRNNNIKAVLIGSDAIVQHHPFFSRFRFPSKRIISFIKMSEDRLFPNVFWGTFNDFLENKVPIVVFSASCQNSPFKLFSSDLKRKMMSYVNEYIYISVRDLWTQAMFLNISNGIINPSVTPDPVFAFNNNVDFIPSKEYILKKYHLPEKYILFGIFNKRKITDNWAIQFREIAKQYGYYCVNLPFPEGKRINLPLDYTIELPLDPLEWYALIKYSSGYIGHNMHPIVVSLHNCVPFFSLDNYGITKFRLFINEKSSKIYHILSVSGFLDNRVTDIGLFNKFYSPDYIWSIIYSFDKNKCKEFANFYYNEYENMMNTIVSKLENIFNCESL